QKRVDQKLLEGYIPAASQLTARSKDRNGSRRVAHYDDRKVTMWLRQLALHLVWQAHPTGNFSQQPPIESGSDIVPHFLWPMGGIRRVRYIHAMLAMTSAGAVMILAAWLLIGPPSVWIEKVKRFMGSVGSFPIRLIISNVLAVGLA